MIVDINSYDSRTFKNIEFGNLPVGKDFYTRRPRLDSTGNDDTEIFKKIETLKNTKGIWVNAANRHGHTTFVQYDKRVVVVEKD